MAGLASAHLHENHNISTSTLKQLKGTALGGNYLRLDQKFELFPALITGKPKVNLAQPPFRDLFGRYKQQRNAFAHPSIPFHAQNEYGVLNEARFHDITLDGVRETVKLTCEAIGIVWKMVYGKPRPSWLPELQEDGRFPNVNVKLVAFEAPPGGRDATAAPTP